MAAEIGSNTNDADNEKSKPKSDDDILEKARKELKNAQDWEKNQRAKMLDDLRFCTLDQWPEDIRRERENDAENGQRPCLTIDKINQYIVQVVNDLRQGKPGINVRPQDDNADVETAKVLKGIIRNIEDQSNADIAYAVAAESMVKIGLGYFRICTEYIDDDSFDQDIFIRSIPNTFSVYMGRHIMPDGSDAENAFVVEEVPTSRFREEFPKAKYKSEDFKSVGDNVTFWKTEDTVTVVEWYCIESTGYDLYFLSDGTTMADSDYAKWPAEAGPKPDIVKTRRSLEKQLKWYKITGVEVLDKRDLPGEYIPVVEMVGREAQYEGERILWGLVRPAKDSLRMYNYWAALDLNTKLPTPSGWTTMRDVQEGDSLFDEKGKPCRVTGTSPIYINHRCFEVELDNGQKIIADATHQWKIEDRGKRQASGWKWKSKVVSTEDLDPRQHVISVAYPVETEHVTLAIHPYLLGIWLGDGTSASAQITEDVRDVEELRYRLETIGYKCGRARTYAYKPGAANFTVHGITDKLRALGVLSNKHIPLQYLRASKEQRWNLMQGLMDSDGTVNKTTKQCSFTTTIPAIRDGMFELAVSLGLKITTCEREERAVANSDYVHSTSWQLSFSCGVDDDVFQMPRKREILCSRKRIHHRRTKQYRIKMVREIPSVPVKCVMVDSPSHLYLAGESMVPTHNSTITEKMALSPKAPFIGAVGQFVTAQDRWKKANRNNYSYLEYDPIDINGNAVPRPERQGSTPMEAAMLHQLQMIEHDVQTSLGMFKAAVGETESQQSGRAILALQRESDTGTYHFGANQGISIRHAGRIILGWIPTYYDTKRIVRILGEDGTTQTAQIDPNQQTAYREIQDLNGDIKRIHNPSLGKYDIAITVGPSYNTKRMEAAATLTEVVKSNPQMMPLIGDLMFRSLDFPFSDQIAERLRKMLPPQLQEGQGDPAVHLAQAMQKMQQMGQAMQQMGQENQQLKSGAAADMAKVQATRDAQMAAHQLKLEEAQAAHNLNIANVENDAKLTIFKARLEAATKIEVAQIAAKGSLSETAIQAATDANLALSSEIKPDGNTGDIPAAPMTPIDKLTQMHQQSSEMQMQGMAQLVQAIGQIGQQLLANQSKPKTISLGGIKHNGDGSISGASATVN